MASEPNVTKYCPKCSSCDLAQFDSFSYKPLATVQSNWLLTRPIVNITTCNHFACLIVLGRSGWRRRPIAWISNTSLPSSLTELHDEASPFHCGPMPLFITTSSPERRQVKVRSDLTVSNRIYFITQSKTVALWIIEWPHLEVLPAFQSRFGSPENHLFGESFATDPGGIWSQKAWFFSGTIHPRDVIFVVHQR